MPINPSSSLVSGLAGGVRGVQYTFVSKATKQPDWQLLSFTMQEWIARPYRLDLQLASDEPDGDPAAMLGKDASLGFARDEEHRVHGIVIGVRSLPSTEKTRLIEVTIAPALAALRLSSTSRIFSDTSAPDVALQVLSKALEPFGRKASLDLSRDDYPVLEYLVQHRETDLTFLQRILAEHGLWYYFKHPLDEGAVEELVITDSPERAPKVAESPEVELVRDRERPSATESVDSLGSQEQLATSSVRVRQFDWTHPERSDDAEKPSDAPDVPVLRAYEHGDVASFEYSAPSYRKHDTVRQAQLRLSQARAGTLVFHGTGNVTSLRPGHFMRLEDREYLLVEVFHHGGSGKEGGQQSQRGRYSNKFTCVPRETPYRVARPMKSRIDGPQLATVVDRTGNATAPGSSSEGDDIVVDKHGRVRVKFPWDLTPARQGGSNSCWLRVAQTWAGQGWGTQFLPRVGMEVMVQFIDGDPDLPLVTGALYNGLNPPPYASAAQQSGIKTRSSVTATGYNEWSFVDTNEQEKIVVRAQRDYAEVVLHDHSTTVHEKQSQTVGGSQSETVGINQSLATHGRHKAVGCNDVHAIKSERTTFISKKNVERFNDTHEISVDKAVLESYLDTHTRKVTGTQTLEAQADKLEHVLGTLELTTDTAHVLKQGKTTRTYQDGKVLLDCSSMLTVVRGPASLTSDESDNVVIDTPGTISFEAGASKLVISASGVELTAPKIDIKVQGSSLALTPASCKLAGQNTTIEATAICQVRGMALLTLN